MLKYLLGPPQTETETATPEPSKLSAGKIAGVVIGGFVFVAIICLLIYLYVKRRGRERRPVIANPGDVRLEPREPNPGIQGNVLPRTELPGHGSSGTNTVSQNRSLPSSVHLDNRTEVLTAVAVSPTTPTEPVIGFPIIQPEASAAGIALVGERSGDRPPGPSKRRRDSA